MTGKKLLATIAAALLPGMAVGLGVMSAHSAARQRPPREILPDARPLSERLLPDDTDVTIKGKHVRPLTVQPPKGTSQVEWALQSESAVVVTLTQALPSLTEERNWIQTQWTATVDDLLRLFPGAPFSVGSSFTFVIDSGDLQVGKVAVHARYGWARELVLGQKYLLFVRWIEGTQRVLVGPDTEYRVLADGSLELADKTADEVSGRPLTQVASEIRKWVLEHPGR